MRTRYLVFNFTACSGIALSKNTWKQLRPKCLFGAWVLLAGVATLGWLIGLAFAAIWLVQRAIS